MAKAAVKFNPVKQPKLAKHDIKLLDLAFALDCTISMGPYISSAQDNILKIVEEIVATEKSEVRLALVEYRDHPPEDMTFVTRTHDFTTSTKTMKGWLSESSAMGGGDFPEAVADAWHDVLKLDWREDATKICVCISDAPPHGLGATGDAFPDGSPNGIDPVETVHKMASKGITLYMVGCEPSISGYKDFFMAMAYITGGQYVPLKKSQLLAKVIIGGAQEELSLSQFMKEADEEVKADLLAGKRIDEKGLSNRVHMKMSAKGLVTKQLHKNKAELEDAESSKRAMAISGSKSLKDAKESFLVVPSNVDVKPGTEGEDESFEMVEAKVSFKQTMRMVKKSISKNSTHE